MNLSEHFTLAEMLSSQTATRKGIEEQFKPGPEIIDNLRALCVNILEPLRRSLGVPIRISSGYRCQRLNRAIGGATNSQHRYGQAADISSPDVSNREILERIIALRLPIDQMISEFEDKHGEPAWIHVSFGPRHRRQILRAQRINNRVVYTEIKG